MYTILIQKSCIENIYKLISPNTSKKLCGAIWSEKPYHMDHWHWAVVRTHRVLYQYQIRSRKYASLRRSRPDKFDRIRSRHCSMLRLLVATVIEHRQKHVYQISSAKILAGDEMRHEWECYDKKKIRKYLIMSWLKYTRWGLNIRQILI